MATIGEISDCIVCDTAFPQRRLRQRFCSDRCRMTWHSGERKRLIEVAREAEEATALGDEF